MTENTRATLRAQIFGAKKLKSEVVNIFGADIEVRQPTLGEILNAQEEPDRKRSVLQMLIRFAYIPGTDEKVFEEADMDQLLTMPFGDDLVRLNKALERMTSINIADAEGNSTGTQGV